MNIPAFSVPTPNPTGPRRLLLFTASAILLVCQAQAEPPPGIEKGARLVLSTKQIEPTTTFEVRFDVPVAAYNKVGTAAAESPLAIKPAIRGAFTWLSQRSGVFKPEEPPALGTEYRVTLRPGLKNAGGALLTATLSRIFQTPPFTATGFSPAKFEEKNAPANPEIHVQFNVNVDAATAGKFIAFEDDGGTRVPALVNQTKKSDDYYFEGDGPSTWLERFTGGQPAPKTRRKSADNEIPNCLYITPSRPLPVGKGWRLVLDKGLPSGDGALHIPAPVRLAVGEVIPFAVSEVLARNGVESGKRIVINFSKRISPLLKADDLPKWVAISPVPDHFKMEPAWDQITLTGDFDLSARYTVTVKAGLPAAIPFKLDKETEKTVGFTPIPSRLYFPAFSTHQISGGARRFDVRAVNLQEVLVQARLLTRDSLVPALRGYNGMYYKESEAGEEENYEPYQKFDPLVLSGKTVYEKTFKPFTGQDAVKTVPLNWDDILGAQKSGAVLLTAKGPTEKETGTQALVQVTDLGLFWKYTHDAVMVYVFSHATGRPVPGATVCAVSDDNTTLLSQATDANGVTQFAIPEKTGWLLAEKDGDLHAVSFRVNNDERGVGDREDHNLPLYHFDNIPLRWYGRRNEEARRLLMFTERPAYQPGETVHLKAILRDWKESELVIPEGATGTLRCEDSRSQKFFEQKIAFSPAGSLDLTIPLPKGAVGTYDYTLTLDGDESGHSGHFRVEEYKPNAFELSFKSAESFGADEKVAVPLTAKYFFGAPLAKARVKWSVEAADREFTPDGFGKYEFGPRTGDDSPGREQNASSFSTQGEGAVDENGTLVLQPEITVNQKSPGPRAVSLLAEVTDLNQQTISARASFVKQSSAFYLGIRRFDDDRIAGEPLPVAFVAVNPDGTPHPDPVKARLELQRIDYHTVCEQGAGGALKYRNIPSAVKISEQQADAAPVVKSGNDWEITPGVRPPSVTPATPGTYLLRLSAKDATGHDILTEYTFSVVTKNPSQTTWAYRNEAQIDLVPDKREYTPGETASILVKTPINGEALVTVERDKVLRTFVVTLDGNTPSIRVPLEKSDSPNIFVSVFLVRGHEKSPRKIKTPDYRVGYCQVNVVRPETKLSVAVQPGAPSYRPGQEAVVEAVVKDSNGTAVPGAEVTLYAVDEGVLSLTGYERPDPFEFFYATQPLMVRPASSLPALFPEDPEQLVFSNKGYLVGDKGDEGGKGRVRKDFLACAFWKADMTTDDRGTVRAVFKAPDSLTRYRLVAVVQTAKNQFGSGESSFEINKPLMIEPSLPRFANITDRMTARAVLHNRTGQPGDVQLTVQLDGKALSDGAVLVERKVKIPANGSVTVDFPVEFFQAGPTKWTWSARMTGAGKTDEPFEDAVQSTLAVGYVAPLLHETLVGRTGAKETNLLAEANPQLLETSGTMSVRLANTRLLGLGEAVKYLQEYPYGCVEQTSSQMIPWILAADLQKAVPELKKTPEEIKAAIESGVTRLLSMQTSGGGLSFWPGGRQPMLWASAYGGFALATAQRHGHPVPAGSLDKICDYLRQQLRNIPETADEYELGPRCLALYTLALAGHAEQSYHETVFKRRAFLSAESRALLALAIIESKGPEAMVAELIDSKMPRPPQPGWWFGSNERELSVRLMAWSRYRPKDRAVDTLAEELLHARKHGRWNNTQENAWALLALATYAAQVETGVKQFGGSLKYGAESDPFHLDDTTPLFETGHAVAPVTADKPDPQPLLLSNPDKGLVFTMVQIEGRARVGKQPPQDRGYSIRRTYEKINDDGTTAPAKEWSVGDRVLVTIRIETRSSAHYLAVDDPLPAIFEAVNPAFKSQEMKTGLEPEIDWFTDYREIRSDRALFFGDHIPPGNYTIRYLARVCAAGAATAPAVKIEEMYHPERFGLGVTEEVSSRPLK